MLWQWTYTCFTYVNLGGTYSGSVSRTGKRHLIFAFQLSAPVESVELKDMLGTHLHVKLADVGHYSLAMVCN